MMAKPHMRANYVVQNFTCAAEKSLSTFDCGIYALVIYFFDDYLYDSLSPLAIYATKLYWCIHS